MLKLYVGLSKEVALPKGGFLFIDDEVPDIPRARVFDPLQHSFNPSKGISYKKAREIADTLYTIAPQGENTLTVRNGKRALLKAMLDGDRLDKVEPSARTKAEEATAEEVRGMIADLLASPVLEAVLCQPTNFSFNTNSMILARLNRAELGDFDCLVLGLLLISHFQGQIIVPDLGFYGRDAHVSLIREGRLIAGVNFLGELPTKLRNSALLIKDKVASGARPEDAEVLASYERLVPATNAYNEFVQQAVGLL
jgi:hypothetical protein